MTQGELRFYGPNLTEKDERALGRQLREVVRLMADGKWRTVQEIAQHVQGTETALSARLRDCRNRLGYLVDSRRVAEGSRLYEFRVRLP